MAALARALGCEFLTIWGIPGPAPPGQAIPTHRKSTTCLGWMCKSSHYAVLENELGINGIIGFVLWRTARPLGGDSAGTTPRYDNRILGKYGCFLLFSSWYREGQVNEV